MLPMSATLSEITSNARLKEYPSGSILQVANYPIFRCPGFEPRVRSYDVPPKGEAADPERSKASSRARARAAVRDIALCNHFDCFFTWTLDPELIDRFNREIVAKKSQTFLRNAAHRKGFQCVVVPELHKDGAIHMHGLCNLGKVRIQRAINPYTGQPMVTDRGQPIYNMLDWGWGHSTCIPIDENYERTCNYVTKYINKSSDKIFGKWYYASRSLVKHPPVELVDGVDYDGFRADNPKLSEIPLYRDVRMVSMHLLGEGATL